MITFYPGPSKIYPQVEQYLADAYQSGILSMNHRSDAFMSMLENVFGQLHRKLDLPSDYEIYFTSSATECWEIIAQSLLNCQSLHLYNGAFGKKWYEYTHRLCPRARPFEFNLHELPDPKKLSTELPGAEVVCLTHSETSNGTMLPGHFLKDLRNQTDELIAVDATSSMGGVLMDWSVADVWYASVQKCFGLPPGLGIMIVSPRAIERAEQLGSRNHYNSLLYIRENFQKHQSPHTPNTLGIYLLGRVMEQVPSLGEIHRQTENRAAQWYHFLESNKYKPLVQEPGVRSTTVMAVEETGERVKYLKKGAMEAGIMLGSGYGPWKETTFRIANFPALEEHELDYLKDFLRRQSNP
ncbi:aminotransferase class V-fold PLP-dependent enzyme [Telluribacter sp.]|jgi:phosphoserine aminotransferase|uniref:aminotransferase class V-fold PLP-dependent enzyme n=1 Tax=Telluribacter sp. TaxID=1978767 RepID=UPI002E14FEBB|nr:aminotransferase class V-fold PLP-dependent enzyme [Telluribacter sp.]